MKKKMSKKNKVICSLLAVGLFSLIVIPATIKFVNAYSDGKIITVKSVIDNSIKSTNDNKYCSIDIDIFEEIDGSGESNITNCYIFKKERDSTDTAYSYTYEGELQNEFWTEIGDGTYSVYLNLDGVWVQTETLYEPIQVSPWTMIESAYDYTLMDEAGEWGESKIECYVFSATGQSDEYDKIGEWVYVSKDSLLPIGVLTTGTTTSTSTEDLEVTTITTVRYDLTWSNDDSNDVTMPETFITDEEYEAQQQE